MSFVETIAPPVDLAPGVPPQPWTTSGDWGADNAKGRLYAEIVAREGNAMAIVGALRRSSDENPVDVGFMYRIAELAVDGAA